MGNVKVSLLNRFVFFFIDRWVDLIFLILISFIAYDFGFLNGGIEIMDSHVGCSGSCPVCEVIEK